MQPQTLYDILKNRRSINLRDLLPGSFSFPV